MEDIKKRSWAEVRLGAIEHNYRALKAALPAGTRVVGVVKADGYGHGAIPVARRLQDIGGDYLAVACLEELRALRAAGITLPVLILGWTAPVYAPELVDLDATQAVGELAYAEQLSEALRGTNKTLRIHLKLETGMGRTGFRAFGEHALAQAARAARLPGLYTQGIFTHFCVSDADDDRRAFTLVQAERFRNGIAFIEAELGRRLELRHCANSGATLHFPELAMDMARPGICLYGLYPGKDHGSVQLRPAMSFYTRVAYVRDYYPGDTVSYGQTYTVTEKSRLAVLTAGYADGLHRALSGKLQVVINGHRVPQVGRICMDMCMADVTGLDVKSGDAVEIFGENMPVDALADAAGTINYELTCALTPRVPRVYVD